MNRGYFLAVEGVDGAGKTTQALRLERFLEAQGFSVITTKEPTKGHFGELIRKTSRSRKLVPVEIELEWFIRDREEHLEKVIEPALARGATVISDRYYLSTVAYQGARNLDFRVLLADCEAKFRHPDVAFWLDIEPTVGLERIAARGGQLDPIFERFERLDAAAKIFRAMSKMRSDYIARIDASPDPEKVEAAIHAQLTQRLELWMLTKP